MAVNARGQGIEEGDLARFAFKVHGDLVGTDALGNAASLTCDDVGLADGIQQSCLTVVDVAHDGNDRRARLEILVILQFFLVKVDVELLEQFLVFPLLRRRAGCSSRSLRPESGRSPHPRTGWR